MRPRLLSAAGGFLLALGLGTAGLTDPRRIVGFLDVGGAWDPTALIVLVAATAVFGVGYRAYAASSRARPGYPPPSVRGRVDGSLVVGAALFGVGWGLSGLCPGPALVSLAAGSSQVLVFVAAMIAGMAVHARWAQGLRERP